jgi:hypothetical protein
MVELKSYDSLEDMLTEMEEENRKHPIRYWINSHLSGYAGYNAYYILLHLWEVPEEWWRQIKWAWQRVFRGWDDRVIWSIDWYLTDHIPTWLEELKRQKVGVPCECFDSDDWDEMNGKYKEGAFEKAESKFYGVLDDIIAGFRANAEIEEKHLWIKDSEYPALAEKFNRGFDLFKEYYGSFWD